jgi:hypothetical protein
VEALLSNIYLWFTNNIEINDTTKVHFRRRITNNTPYIMVNHERKGYEPVYDIDEMFALVKKELDGETKYKEMIDQHTLKKMKINTDFTLEPVP